MRLNYRKVKTNLHWSKLKMDLCYQTHPFVASMLVGM
jgi:hypothetical protein